MTLDLYLKRNHFGQENAVLSKELELLFSMKGAEIRKIVNDCRARGVPICSCKKGYFYASSPAETSATIKQLESRIKRISIAKNGLIKSKDTGETS